MYTNDYLAWHMVTLCITAQQLAHSTKHQTDKMSNMMQNE